MSYLCSSKSFLSLSLGFWLSLSYFSCVLAQITLRILPISLCPAIGCLVTLLLPIKTSWGRLPLAYVWDTTTSFLGENTISKRTPDAKRLILKKPLLKQILKNISYVYVQINRKFSVTCCIFTCDHALHACMCVCVWVYCYNYSTFCKTFTQLKKFKQRLLNESGISEN